MFERALKACLMENNDAGACACTCVSRDKDTCKNLTRHTYEYLKYLKEVGTPMTIEELFKKYNFTFVNVSRCNPMNKK